MLKNSESRKKQGLVRDSGNGGAIFDDIEALSRSLSSEIRQRTFSAGKSQFKALANDSQPHKDKRSSSSSSIWNWKPLRALSHVRNRRFDCRFTLRVHSIDGLSSDFDGAAICVRWKRNIAELGLCTRHGRVRDGAARFEETLEHRCHVYGSRGGGPHHTAKYEARYFILYVSVIGAPEIDLGKHRVDLTRLLPLNLEELEAGSTGKWSTSFNLSGKGKNASLNVSFGFSVVGGGDPGNSAGRKKKSEILQEGLINSMRRVGSPLSKSLSEVPSRAVKDSSLVSKISMRRVGSPLSKSVSDAPSRSVQSLGDVSPISTSEVMDWYDGGDLGNPSGCNKASDLRSDDMMASKNGKISMRRVERPVSKSLSEVPSRTVEDLSHLGEVSPISTSEFESWYEVEDYSVEKGVDQTEEIEVEDFALHGESGESGESGERESEGPDHLEFVMSDSGTEENGAALYGNAENFINYAEESDHPREILAQLSASSGELPICDFSDQEECISDSELVWDELEAALENLSIFGSTEFAEQTVEKHSFEESSFMDSGLDDSFDDVADTVASEFFDMLGIDDDPNPESPKERLWQEFKNESLEDFEGILDHEEEEEEEENFDLLSLIHAAEEEHDEAIRAMESLTRCRMLEHEEVEAVKDELYLPSDVRSEESVDLPPISEGMGSFVQTKDGGFLRSMNPTIFPSSQGNGSLIMQVSSPVVVPAEMGSNAGEILQSLASVGIEKLSIQANKLMPLEDITGKSIQQISGEAAVPPLPKSRRAPMKIASKTDDNNYVSLEELAPLAMEKIEALSVEGLRIQSELAEEEAPAGLQLEGKNGAVGLQLLKVNGCDDGVDGLMGLSISLDEWLRLDSGAVSKDQINERMAKILAAHHATSSAKWGLLGKNFTVALMVQLRDPLRDFEPVGAPMLSLIQVERLLVPPKLSFHYTVSDKGNSEEAEEEEKEEEDEPLPKVNVSTQQFKITEVHLAGLKSDPGERRLWGGPGQRQSGSRWLIANGMGKTDKHPLLRSTQSWGQLGQTLWNISYRVNPRSSRNPNILIPR
ncbi:EEIG1/EHBP1 protein amino-terminal domain protein [Wolffia australiana]